MPRAFQAGIGLVLGVSRTGKGPTAQSLVNTYLESRSFRRNGHHADARQKTPLAAAQSFGAASLPRTRTPFPPWYGVLYCRLEHFDGTADEMQASSRSGRFLFCERPRIVTNDTCKRGYTPRVVIAGILARVRLA